MGRSWMKMANMEDYLRWFMLSATLCLRNWIIMTRYSFIAIYIYIYRWLGREGRQQQKWTFDLTYALRLVEIPNTQNGWFSFLCHCIILHGYFDQVPRSPFNKNGMFVMGWFSIDWFVWPIWCYFEDYLCLAICKHKGHKNISNNFSKKSLL